MRTVSNEIKVYNADDVKNDVDGIQSTVLEKMHDLNTHYEWWDCTTDQWNDILTVLGFSDTKIYFRGFSSQGDGACFVSDWFEYNKGFLSTIKKEYPQWTELHETCKNLMEIYKKSVYRFYGNIKHRGHYYHENSIDLTLNVDHGCGEDWAKDEHHDEFKEVVQDICRMIYKHLEEEYEYLSSEKAILESIEANEYEFTEDGEIYAG